MFQKAGGGSDCRFCKFYHILAPETPNRTWHLDLTTIRILWIHFHIAAVLDGFSRKLLTISILAKAPTSNDVARLLSRTVAKFGAPRFLVTDHGLQFKKRFKVICKRISISHIQGRPYDPKFNGKIERLFRTLKLWQRVAMLFLGVAHIQVALNRFAGWYNTQRTHQSLGGLTPEEARTGAIPCNPRFAWLAMREIGWAGTAATKRRKMLELSRQT